MRILVTGGTVFLSRAVAEAAVSRGHAVVCAARGASGPQPAGAALLRVDWECPYDLSRLAGMSFDAVIDVAHRGQRHVRQLADAIGPGAGHWVFVSSCLVYRDRATPGQRPGAPVVDAAASDAGQRFAQVKLASEEIIARRFPHRALIVRPGLIAGPGDVSDRFGYWPARLDRGGIALAPGSPGDLVQWIDVRDLANWLVRSAESRRSGIIDAVGQPRPIGDVLAGIAAAVGRGVRLTWIPQQFLLRCGVRPWSGKCSIPLWVRRPEETGLLTRDPAPLFDSGFHPRDLSDTACAALEWERVLGTSRARKAGLTPDEERRVLNLWRQAGGVDELS